MIIPSSKTSAWAARLQTAQARSRSPTPRGGPGALCPGPTHSPPGADPRGSVGSSGPGAEGRPSSPHVPPPPLCALPRGSSAHRRRGAAGWGWGGRWVAARPPVLRCPPPTALPRRCEDTLAPLEFRISEALCTGYSRIRVYPGDPGAHAHGQPPERRLLLR